MYSHFCSHIRLRMLDDQALRALAVLVAIIIPLFVMRPYLSLSIELDQSLSFYFILRSFFYAQSLGFMLS